MLRKALMPVSSCYGGGGWLGGGDLDVVHLKEPLCVSKQTLKALKATSLSIPLLFQSFPVKTGGGISPDRLWFCF